MDRPALLLQRLEQIGQSLAATDQAQALLGLGSVGVERARLDEYSDLDFFVVAQDGCKLALLQDLSWLNTICPVVYAFKNTAEGYKVLFEDGVYCEFGVFERDELASATFAEGRLVWKTPDFDEQFCRPQHGPAAPQPRTIEWMVGEALTCLYVGLCRYRRGEKLSAFRFIQFFVVDRIVELAASLEEENPAFRDGFSAERRFEQRFPHTAQLIAPFMQGYESTPQSALAILDFLDRRFEVNPAMKAEIQKLAQNT